MEVKSPKVIKIKKESIQQLILPSQFNTSQLMQLKSPEKTPKVITIKKENLISSPKVRFLNQNEISGQKVILLKKEDLENLLRGQDKSSKLVYINKKQGDPVPIEQPKPKVSIKSQNLTNKLKQPIKLTKISGGDLAKRVIVQNVDSSDITTVQYKSPKRPVMSPNNRRLEISPLVVKSEPVEQIIEEQVGTDYEVQYLDELLEECVPLAKDEETVLSSESTEVTMDDRWTRVGRSLSDAEMYNEVIITEPSATHECRVCSLHFESEELKEEHMREAHTFSYECTQCEHRTANATAARAHFREAHRARLVYADEEQWNSSDFVSTEIKTLMVEDAEEDVTEEIEETEYKTDEEDEVTEEVVDENGVTLTYECHFCFKSFVTEKAHRAHVLKHETNQARAAKMAEEQTPHCDECNLNFETIQEWNKHVLTSRKHKDKKRIILNGCRQCGETFPSPNELRVHMKDEHPGVKSRVNSWTEPHPCALCGDMMESSHRYWAHFRRVHPGEEYPLKQHYPHKCDECGSEFRCRALLKMHMNKHTGVRMFKCNECPKSFFTSLSLRYHQISHSELRPFECEVCGRGFKFKAGMERHQLVHTGERPYVCGVCGQGFTTMHWTQLHVRKVHNNEHIPYKPRHRKRRANKKKELSHE